MILCTGTGAPPLGWDADEAVERILAVTHSAAPHVKWLNTPDENGDTPVCKYCAMHELLEIARGNG